MNRKPFGIVAVLLLIGVAVAVSVVLFHPDHRAAGNSPLPTFSESSASPEPGVSSADLPISANTGDPQGPTASADSVDTVSPREQLPDPNVPQLIIEGRVTLASGDPASSAQLALVYWENVAGDDQLQIPARVVAAPDGSYHIQTADGPLFSLSANKKGTVGVAVGVRQEDPSETLPGPPPTRLIHRDLALLESVTVEGQVIDENDAPLAGVPVFASKMPASDFFSADPQPFPDADLEYTQSDGSFSLTRLPAGPVYVRVDREGYSPAIVETTAPTDNVVLRLHKDAAEIVGHVYLKSTGEAAFGAMVRLRDEDPCTDGPGRTKQQYLTEADGLFHFRNIAEGRYIIQAEKDQLRLVPSGSEDGLHYIDLALDEIKTGVDLYLESAPATPEPK